MKLLFHSLKLKFDLCARIRTNFNLNKCNLVIYDVLLLPNVFLSLSLSLSYIFVCSFLIFRWLSSTIIYWSLHFFSMIYLSYIMIMMTIIMVDCCCCCCCRTNWYLSGTVPHWFIFNSSSPFLVGNVFNVTPKLFYFLSLSFSKHLSDCFSQRWRSSIFFLLFIMVVVFVIKKCIQD